MMREMALNGYESLSNYQRQALSFVHRQSFKTQVFVCFDRFHYVVQADLELRVFLP